MSHPGARQRTAQGRHHRLGLRRAERAPEAQAGQRRRQADRPHHTSPVPAAAVPGGDGHHLRRRDRAAHPGDPAQAGKRRCCWAMSPTSTSAKHGHSKLLGHDYRPRTTASSSPPGAGQSYFGNDQFAEFAPGMKSIDDALELRGRILGAFELAERSDDPSGARSC